MQKSSLSRLPRVVLIAPELPGGRWLNRQEQKELAVVIEAFRGMDGEDATESDEEGTAVDDVATVLCSAVTA